jgi:hypothetical protein
MKQKCNYLRNALDKKVSKEKSLNAQLKRAQSANAKLTETLNNLKDRFQISEEASLHLKKYDGDSTFSTILYFNCPFLSLQILVFLLIRLNFNLFLFIYK